MGEEIAEAVGNLPLSPAHIICDMAALHIGQSGP